MRQPAFIDQALFAGLAQKASDNPRARQHHNFHEMSEPCHRMAVGLQPATYIPPHRHLSDDKAEALIVLKGRLGLLIFDDQGRVIDKRLAKASPGWRSTRPGCARSSTEGRMGVLEFAPMPRSLTCVPSFRCYWP